MIKGVIFDLWGTLVDNGVRSPLYETYKIIRPRMAYTDFVPKFEQAVMTQEFKSQTEAFEEGFKALDVMPKDWLIDKLVGVWNSNTILSKLYDETIEVIEGLKKKKLKLAIISNLPSFSAQVIEKFNLDKYFDTIILSYDAGILKTNPKMFEQVLKKIKLQRHEVLMVGDSMETDVAGAILAGVKPILLDRKNKRVYEDRILDLKELDKYL